MLRKTIAIINFLLLFWAYNCAAQKSIGVDTTGGYSVPVLVQMGSTQNFVVSIKNTGTLSVTDNLTIYAACDTGNSILNTFYTGSLSVNFNSGDTVSYSFSDSISPTQFKSGINTVVIWPVANASGAATSCSLSVKMTVDTALGINNKIFLNDPVFYPNPAKDFLYVKSFNSNSPYNKIKLYDMYGRLVMESVLTKQIDVSALMPGIYTIVLTGPGNDQRKTKFLKE